MIINQILERISKDRHNQWWEWTKSIMQDFSLKRGKNATNKTTD